MPRPACCFPSSRSAFFSLDRVCLVVVLAGALLIPATAPMGLSESANAEATVRDMAWASTQDGLAVRGISGLRISPKDGRFFAHIHGRGPCQSNDNGKTWKPLLEGTGVGEGRFAADRVRISLDPREPKIMYLVVNGDLFRSIDSGATFSKLSAGGVTSSRWDKLAIARLAWDVHVDIKKSSLLLVGTRTDGRHHGGLFESQDSGNNWKLIAGSSEENSGLGHDTFLIRRDPKSEKYLTVAGRTGVWYSDTRGRSFSPNLPGIKGVRTLDVRGLSEFVGGRDLYLADARGIWHSKDGGAGWSKKPVTVGDVQCLAVDAHSRKRLVAVFRDKGLMDQASRKRPWVSIQQAATKDEEPGDSAALEIRDLVFHPKDKLLYALSPVTGLHVVKGEGKTAKLTSVPVDDASWPTDTAAIAHVGLHTGGGAHTHLALSREGVVYRSDEGTTWHRQGRTGMDPRGLRAELTAPKTWYAWGRSLLKSEDDGATWETLWSPKDDDYVADFKQCPGGVLHILLGRAGTVLRFAAPGPNKPSVWAAMRAPDDSFAKGASLATAFALDPNEGQHIVVCARSVNDRWTPKDKAGGVWETWDGGKKWTSLAKGLTVGDPAKDAYWNHARFVFIDPASNLLVYGANWYGLRARQCVSPKADAATKKAAWTTWVDITPPEKLTSLGSAHISAFAASGDDDARSYVVQLRTDNGATALVGIDGKTIGMMWSEARFEANPPKKGPPEKKDGEKPNGDGPRPSWRLLKDPGVVLASLVADPSVPGRLIAGDAHGPQGILRFEVPSAAPKDEPNDEGGKGSPEKKEPEEQDQDGAEKDGDKKDEPSEEAPKK